MKKLTIIFLSVLFLLAMLVQTGCEKSTSSDADYRIIEIEVLSPVANDSIPVADSIIVTSKLTGFTFEYSAINYYFGESTTPAGTFSKSQLTELALTQEKDAQFDFLLSTKDLTTDVPNINLTVEAVGLDLTKYSVVVPVILTMPTIDDRGIDINILSPALNDTLKMGEIIPVEVELAGNLALFKSLEVKLQNDSIWSSYDAEKLNFEYPSSYLPAGTYRLEFELRTDDDIIIRYRDFVLIEYVPTYTNVGATGYSLKSIIKTFDNGCLTVSSDVTAGTRVVKYNQEGDLLWSQTIPASVGIAESVCEDTEYDKGYVIAGWRNNGTDKDTWVRKISTDDGSLIWNKHFGYDGVDDGATVIKKSIDDGYIIGGYTYNLLGTGSFTISCPVDTETYNYETGYDVRLVKIYSNGNEVWGQTVHYVSHSVWQDITGHEYVQVEGADHDEHYIKKMGDQYITDLVVKDNGNFLVTGWNNFRLYDSGTEGLKKDMFYAEMDCFGGYINTTTWGTMSAYDLSHMSTIDSFIKWGHPTYGIGFTVFQANHLGDYSEDEIGYGLVESYGGYGGDVVMVGSTYQLDDGPVKSKLNDAWIVEYALNNDEDGVLWEYTFGEVGKNDVAYGIDRTLDGGYVITGYTTGTDQDTWLLKLDAELNLLWSKKYGVAGFDSGVKVLQTMDGGILIGGNEGTGATARAKVIKVNKKGEF